MEKKLIDFIKAKYKKKIGTGKTAKYIYDEPKDKSTDKILNEVANRTQLKRVNKRSGHNGFTKEELSPFKNLVKQFGKFPSKEMYQQSLEKKYNTENIMHQEITEQEAINLWNLEKMRTAFSFTASKPTFINSVNDSLNLKGRGQGMKLKDIYKIK